ncbi:MAG: RDD family protein [Bacteroidales bacterium]|nr:RDD family protein [Bacteroidales bacterium]
MTREEQLKFCKVCKNQKFDFTHGIICNITNLPAEFDSECDFFEEDTVLKAKSEGKSVEDEICISGASKSKRFANYLLDSIFMFLFSTIIMFLLYFVGYMAFPGLIEFLDADSTLQNYVIGFLMAMLYYSIFEATTGRTIAKFITRTKVVTFDGNKPEFERIFIRSLCRFIPFEAFSILFSDSDLCWHDTISKTRVINV